MEWGWGGGRRGALTNVARGPLSNHGRSQQAREGPFWIKVEVEQLSASKTAVVDVREVKYAQDGPGRFRLDDRRMVVVLAYDADGPAGRFG